MKGFDREVASLAIKPARHLTQPPCTVVDVHTTEDCHSLIDFSARIDFKFSSVPKFQRRFLPRLLDFWWMRKQSVGGLERDYCSRFEAWKENVAYSQTMPSLLDDRCAS